ncbi:hypothetical protein Nepgr_010792 [Nepenthes gracilis]|uniref:Uncharacterized protein n=1 Tax=Nepenthes gracilis TaxID=150966 RepID=A0AAD3XLD7_NEPGR|nr:hypothetical protein Nepgr_010792 [Nepenthes gracilis]
MNTPIPYHHQPPLSTTRVSPFHSRNHLPSSPSTAAKSHHLSQTTFKVQAEAKGFTSSTSAAATIKHKKTKQKQIASPKKDDPSKEDHDDQIPQVVTERMTGRIFAFVGLPMAAGLAMLQAFSILKDRQLWDVPLWLPFLTTLVTFGMSTLGIVFGTLSSSLDPRKQGSFLGIEEAKQNWTEMWKEEDGNISS